MLNRRLSFIPQIVSAPVAFGLLWLIAVRLAGQGGVTPLTLVSREARRTMPVVALGGQEFVALDDLAAAFQLAVREESGVITVSYRGRTIVLTPNQALASVAGRLVSLPAPATRAGNRWMVPLEFINRALALIFDARLELRRPSGLVIVGDLRVPRITIAPESSADATRLTIDATPAAGSAISQEPGRLVVRFDADALDLTLPALPRQGLVQGVRSVDPLSITIDVGPRYNSFRASTQTTGNTARLVLDLLAAATETSTPPAPAPPPAVSAPPELPLFGAPASAIRTIAIDPGHGGDDVGAKGEGGALEKDLTLAAARRLKATIEGRLGIRVLLTRDDDRNIVLDDRIAVANNNKADVFISLHANASMRGAATGASIYVAAFDDRAKAQTTVTPQRVPVFGGGSRDIELVLWDLAQIRHIDRSAELAQMLEEALRARLAVEVRPVDRAPFRVLESANMPAVLVEMGFLTNAVEEKLLSGAAFQEGFAQSVLDALLEFRESLAAPAGGP